MKPDEIRRVAKAFKDEQACVVFLTLVLTGLRKSELQRLRWRDVSLVEKVLRVVDSKSESGIRSMRTRSATWRMLAALVRPMAASHSLPRWSARSSNSSKSSHSSSSTKVLLL